MYKRALHLELANEGSCFLWGPRQTGKSTLLKTLYPEALRYDLLKSSEFRRLLQNPGQIREEILAPQNSERIATAPVLIDEVQKVPDLLDEVHSLIEDAGVRFILCGSSARKLKRGHANLLGGRAFRYELKPLTFPEIPKFDLLSALNSGLLPRFYGSPHAGKMMQAYIGDYLKEEIAAEALTRNIPAFNRFLEIAAISNGELINHQNIARECGVSAPTVKEYFHILEDTLIGAPLPAFTKARKRRIVSAPRFFFFDLAPVIYLTRRGRVEAGSELFGRAFEHLIWMELSAHSSYSGLSYPLSYWRTSSGFEVDFILADGEVAVEVKSCEQVKDKHLKGIRAFKEEFKSKRYIVVSRDSAPRRTADGIDILPWCDFLQQLWNGSILNT
jgi:predicted AAA+ superfamily ATPase